MFRGIKLNKNAHFSKLISKNSHYSSGGGGGDDIKVFYIFLFGLSIYSLNKICNGK
jgi:hypothetical protein